MLIKKKEETFKKVKGLQKNLAGNTSARCKNSEIRP